MQAFIALADPTRRRMVEMLADRELSSGQIGEAFEITAPAVSQHLKVLKEANIVRVRVDGQRRIYTLEAAGFAELERWLAQIKRFWSGRLDQLEEQLLRHKAEQARSSKRKRRPK